MLSRVILKGIYKAAAVMLMALTGVAFASALDLPTKKVKGVEYYYYKVKKGESLYGISKNLGMTVDEIVAANPFAANDIRKGDILLFPKVEEPAEEVVVEEVDVVPADTVEVEEVPKNPAIAVLLPFGLDNAEPSRANKVALEVYKGMLVAADSLADRSGRVDIIARDIDGLSAERVADMVEADSAVARAAVIFAPGEEALFAAVARRAAEGGNYVFNALCIPDTLYASVPMLLQANAPQHVMYEKAVDALLTDFAGFTPVILRSRTGRNEKENFVNYLVERCRAAGVEPRFIEYENNLVTADFDVLPVDGAQKYVVVPSSGSKAEFNKFAYAFHSYRERLKGRAAEALDTAAENGETAADCAVVEVFGYPDWTAFRGDALDMLHRLNATVYSRFFDDFTGFASRGVSSSFRRWFGAEPMESVPSYALIGYDSATWLIKNLRVNEGAFNPTYPSAFEGVQSSFDFRSAGEDAGYYNTDVYIISFREGGRTAVRVL